MSLIDIVQQNFAGSNYHAFMYNGSKELLSEFIYTMNLDENTKTVHSMYGKRNIYMYITHYGVMFYMKYDGVKNSHIITSASIMSNIMLKDSKNVLGWKDSNDTPYTMCNRFHSCITNNDVEEQMKEAMGLLVTGITHS